jgi:uncharacterized protein (UPF0332 family)
MKLPEFDECLKRGKIVRFPAAKKLASKELDVAREDLKTSQKSLKQKGYKWATVQAYYAMFHAARTLLYHQGYREKSHYCLILAMKSFYVSKGVLEMRLVESLQMAKALREGADYENTFDAESAKALVAQAQEFVQVAEKVIAQD